MARFTQSVIFRIFGADAASTELSASNLYYAVDDGDKGEEGTDYGTGTTANADVFSSNLVLDEETGFYVYSVEARTAGFGGNAVPTTKVSNVMSWGNTSLAGGTNAAAANGSFVINVDSGMPAGMIPAAPRSVRAPVVL